MRTIDSAFHFADLWWSLIRPLSSLNGISGVASLGARAGLFEIWSLLRCYAGSYSVVTGDETPSLQSPQSLRWAWLYEGDARCESESGPFRPLML